MAFKLIPPGKRRNKTWYARVSIDGRRHECSTGELDQKRARVVARRFEAELRARGAPGKTVADMIDAYVEFRRPGYEDRRYLAKLRDWLGRRAAVEQGDADEAARALYPGRASETWNRAVYTPLSAVLRHHDVAIRLKRPPMKRPRNRAVSRDVREALIAGAEDPELRLLLLVLFFTGARVSEAIRLTWDRIDLDGRRLRLDATKQDEDQWRPLHDRLIEALANRPGERAGSVFRWRTRAGPRKSLAGLCRRLGLRFTPHQARHTFATLLVDAGASLRDVMDAGGWKSIASVARYVGSNVERQRKVIGRL